MLTVDARFPRGADRLGFVVGPLSSPGRLGSLAVLPDQSGRIATEVHWVAEQSFDLRLGPLCVCGELVLAEISQEAAARGMSRPRSRVDAFVRE